MSELRKANDELTEIAELRRAVEELKSLTLARINKIGSDWKQFTPVLTASTTNPTLGSGGSTAGRYLRLGHFVIYRWRVRFGTSGANGGSGEYRISTPAPISSTLPGDDLFSMGDAVLFDWSVAGHKELAVIARANANNLKLYVKNATVFHNNPFVWTNDDRMGGTAIFQVQS